MIHCLPSDVARFIEIARRECPATDLDQESFFADLMKLKQPIRVCVHFFKDGQCKHGDKCKFLHVANSKKALQGVIERATQGGFEVDPKTYKAAGLPVPIAPVEPEPEIDTSSARAEADIAAIGAKAQAVIDKCDDISTRCDDISARCDAVSAKCDQVSTLVAATVAETKAIIAKGESVVALAKAVAEDDADHT